MLDTNFVKKKPYYISLLKNEQYLSAKQILLQQVKHLCVLQTFPVLYFTIACAKLSYIKGVIAKNMFLNKFSDQSNEMKEHLCIRKLPLFLMTQLKE